MSKTGGVRLNYKSLTSNPSLTTPSSGHSYQQEGTSRVALERTTLDVAPSPFGEGSFSAVAMKAAEPSGGRACGAML